MIRYCFHITKYVLTIEIHHTKYYYSFPSLRCSKIWSPKSSCEERVVEVLPAHPRSTDPATVVQHPTHPLAALGVEKAVPIQMAGHTVVVWVVAALWVTLAGGLAGGQAHHPGQEVEGRGGTVTVHPTGRERGVGDGGCLGSNYAGKQEGHFQHGGRLGQFSCW